MVYLLKGLFTRGVPVIVRPSSQDRIEHPDQNSRRDVEVVPDDIADSSQQAGDTLLRRTGQ